MDRRELRETCLALPAACETFPFGPDWNAFKIAGKIFALNRMALEPLTISVKCDPMLAEQLRATYPAIEAGYHLNKRHWNTITLDGSLPDRLVADMIEDSYDLVVSKLPHAKRRALRWPGDLPEGRGGSG